MDLRGNDLLRSWGVLQPLWILVYWPVRWVMEQTVPGSGSSYGPGCWPLLLPRMLPRRPRGLPSLQGAPARPADSPRRAGCWTEAAAAYLWREGREIGETQLKPNLPAFRSHSSQTPCSVLFTLDWKHLWTVGVSLRFSVSYPHLI